LQGSVASESRRLLRILFLRLSKMSSDTRTLQKQSLMQRSHAGNRVTQAKAICDKECLCDFCSHREQWRIRVRLLD
jgi:hypothetical protein